MGGATIYEYNPRVDRILRRLDTYLFAFDILPFVSPGTNVAGGSSLNLLPFSGTTGGAEGYPLPRHFEVLELRTRVTANTLSGPLNITLQKNETNVETITYAAGQTGDANKWMNVVFDPGDRIRFVISAGGLATESAIITHVTAVGYWRI